ncbi:hypothetical protein DBZ36_02445 [Alginatibacterium sediminis]|uniref:AEC family transporter n=1 Tax=Alginatibacterium sediminis TaxID=2164068 RepID=A0A420ELG6_9ALTE|nr:hypothetical protein [Alginatibacterium sediminis]RKF21528.1 hypothetical protein DBZ36_02445 [Alginatibacterium sediminis]
MLHALLFTIAVIVSGFTLGQILQFKYPQHQRTLSLLFTRIALVFAIPLSLFSAMWQLPDLDPSLLKLPIVGLLTIASGGVLAWIVAGKLKLNSEQKGALIPVGTFMNIGAVGSLCVYLFLGESGLALVPIYKLFEELIYFGVIFPMVRAMGSFDKGKRKPFWQDPILITSLSAVALGFLLNQLQIPRPDFMATVTSIAVPLGSFSLICSVGLVFKIARLSRWRNLGLGLAVSRMILCPLVAMASVWVFGLWNSLDGLVLQVAFLLACMPTGFMSVLPPVLFGLDQELANTGWFYSTLVFLFSLPLIMLVVSAL